MISRIRWRLSSALTEPTGVATMTAGRVPFSIQSASAKAAVAVRTEVSSSAGNEDETNRPLTGSVRALGHRLLGIDQPTGRLVVTLPSGHWPHLQRGVTVIELVG